MQNILVPVDGSEHSKRALEFACTLAEKFDAKLHLLHVAQPRHDNRTMTFGARAVMTNASEQDLEEAARPVLAGAMDVARAAGCTEVDTIVRGGDAAAMIVEAAKDAGVDTIVMGSRGLTGFSGLMLGSVSHKVTHLAPCTCVTVR